MGKRIVQDGVVMMGSEEEEQMMLFRWAEWMKSVYEELELMHHVPNGGKRDIGTAKKMKMQGVKAGVPDVCLPVSRNGYSGLYIELKVGKNKTTDKQEWWIERLQNQGFKVEVCYGSSKAIEVIKNYLGIKE